MEPDEGARTVELGDPQGTFLALPFHASLDSWLCVLGRVPLPL